MDRVQVFPGAIPLETDLLTAQKNDMIGLAKLSAAVLGTATQVNGLACIPTVVPSMQVTVNPGEIYSLQNIDNTAYSSIAADTVHQIMKQGILLDAATLTTVAPSTAGMSVVYLVEAAYVDADTSAVVLPYYNASNPSQAYSGPANAGTANNTARKGQCSVQLKVGIAATTGSQTTPAADSGYIGLYAITVAAAQTTVVAANIVALSGAPFLSTAAQLNYANTFTQYQSGPTPSAGDNTTKYSTTAFLVRALGAYAPLAGAAFTGPITVTGTVTASAGYVGITSANVTGALTYTPYSATNPSGYISGITSAMVTSALTYTPIQQGTGAGQMTNAVKIGWSGAKTKIQVDATDMGNIAMESWQGNSKAWVNFDGTVASPSPRASFNISSVTKNGTGDYTINFATAMNDVNYSPVFSVAGGGSGTAYLLPQKLSSVAQTTTSVRVVVVQVGSGAIDTSQMTVSIFGN